MGYKRDDVDYDIVRNGSITSSISESFIRMFIGSLNEFSVLYQKLNDCQLAVIGKVIKIRSECHENITFL
jgi:hypothetical protein